MAGARRAGRSGGQRRRAAVRLVPRGALALGTAALLASPLAAQSRPDPTRLELTQPVVYFIGEGAAGSGFREGDRILAEWALLAWARQSDPPVRLVPGPRASATIRLHWVSAGEGRYGEMIAREMDGRRVIDVLVHPDTDGLGPDVAPLARLDPLFRDTIVYLTCVHELGHAFGLPHTSAFADIMYSFQYGGDFAAYFMRFREQLESRADIRDVSPFSAADVSAFRALYR